MNNLIPFIPLLPLIGFIITGLFGKNLPKSVVGIIASGTVLGSFILTAVIYNSMTCGDRLSYDAFQWLSVGDLNVCFTLLVDPLSIWMMLIITGIGFLIHVYSTGYMHDDEGFYKFFAYLNLFVFSMLLLVMGGNYLIMFFGWEGVGLCSYLLIGFWYANTEYGKAARKAFIMNRIGDLGLLIGVFLIFTQFGSVDYATVFNPEVVATKNATVITAICIFLFIGAMGKSAQIPLYTWLPDAMAGPTPVSALIHAATMVTAGIYMIVRSNVLYSASPVALEFVAYIGLATSLFAAFIGLRQNDIKKVLAYSTVSQLGLMFLALGVGAYSSAMFHVTTHAFFKALLFLGAGSVIHAMHHAGFHGDASQDMRNMGGLRSKLKITHFVMLVGTLAIIGFPLLSGFFSKDEILAKTYEHSKVMWALAQFSSLITAFYMLRMYFVTFGGSFRGTHEQEHHLHDSPISMTAPLGVLAVLSVIGGAMNMPHIIGGESSQMAANWFSYVIHSGAEHAEHADASTEWMLMGIASVLVFIAIGVCYAIYSKVTNLPVADAEQTGMTKVLAKKFYVDEAYDAVFVRPTAFLSRFMHSILETKFIDGIVNGVGKFVIGASNLFRKFQNGNIEYYFFAMVVGIILILATIFINK